MNLFEAAALHDPEFVLILVLAADTGARRGELSALRWTDLHPDGTVSIARAIVLGPEGPVEKEPKNHDSVRTISLPTARLHLLAEQQGQCDERTRMCGVSLAADAFVFPAEPDGPRPWRPVAGRVGHGGGGATTLKVYGHFLQAQDRAAADLLAELTKRSIDERERATSGDGAG